MNILGSIIRTDEIIGISDITPCHDGNKFYYSFSVITRSSAVEFKSEVVEDVHIATKQEQELLQSFKLRYQITRYQIGIQTGDVQMIIEDFKAQIADKIEREFNELQKATDQISLLLHKSKLKTKEELLQLTGIAWASAKAIKETIIK